MRIGWIKSESGPGSGVLNLAKTPTWKALQAERIHSEARRQPARMRPGPFWG